MIATNLGYPRIGAKRELKKACEQYWSNKITLNELIEVGKKIRKENWHTQRDAGIQLIPSNDFSFYDQVLDMCLTLGCIPKRFETLQNDRNTSLYDLYFAMARGIQNPEFDITAMEMTKWFDTNYHYIVPEFEENETFNFFSRKIIDEAQEAISIGIKPKPVLIGPVTFLKLGKEKSAGFKRVHLINELQKVYFTILDQLEKIGVEYVQFDEPCLALDLNEEEQQAIKNFYDAVNQKFSSIKIILANYFDCYGDNLNLALSLPLHTLHLDLVRCPLQVGDILHSGKLNSKIHLSLGVVDGRNVWKNDYEDSIATILKVVDAIGSNRIMIAPSCSLLHSPCDLDLETNEENLPHEVKQWLAFAKQKLHEVVSLKRLVEGDQDTQLLKEYEENKLAHNNRKASALIHNPEVKNRVSKLTPSDSQRKSSFNTRKEKQKVLGLPLFPTTTIGSFPQTKEVRTWRAKFKKGQVSTEEYNAFLRHETEATIRFQEDSGLDVLVHGEFERNDMVEYFGEQLEGFVFTKFGWVQSYGSRCVKPPIIFGDVSRSKPMTVKWSQYAQSLTDKLVKGMLTGPVTILQWSFVRNDQPRSQTCNQIALEIRDEVVDLEKAGIKVIQIDEPAIREGLPLRKSDWGNYLKWAVEAFRISASGVADETQIHTHMCYSEFNDIIQNIADMDADVITIECSRSQMELLDAFSEFKYPNDIGPGVYDIHSPRVPSRDEMIELMTKAENYIPRDQLWVNPDCGLKTRHWDETKKALKEMVGAAQALRSLVTEEV